jgi:hypothetical protein
MTHGVGADSVLECVGTQEAMTQAIKSTRPGGSGQSSSTTRSTSAATTGSSPAGIKRRFVRRRSHSRRRHDKDVIFEPVEGPINGRIDGAYRAKYAGSPYLTPMIGARARAATVRVLPRG